MSRVASRSLAAITASEPPAFDVSWAIEGDQLILNELTMRAPDDPGLERFFATI